MTARGFLTIRPGFRVSPGATLGFSARCGNHTARRFRKLFKSPAVPAVMVGGRRLTDVADHAALVSRGGPQLVPVGGMPITSPALDVASLRQDQGGICAIGEVGSVTAHEATVPGAGNHDDGPNRYERCAEERKEDAGNRP